MPKFEKQKKYFEHLLRNGLFGHAYLFVGQDSVGKRSFTEDICVLLTGKGFDNNPDLKFIRPDTKEDVHQIDIKSIRDLKSFMYLKPYSSEYKLAVLEDAETISIGAANAMLKILEEPPKKSVLILISSKPKLLLRTILSRCEAVIFPPAPDVQTDEMDKALSELRKTAKQSMAERIKYAKKIYEKEDYAELVNLWLKSLRFQLRDKLFPIQSEQSSATESRILPGLASARPRAGDSSTKPSGLGRIGTTASVLRNLLRLSYIVSQHQYNHRIALENFFVNL